MIESSMGSKYRCIASIFLKFRMVIDEYLVYKRVFGFLPFCLYHIKKRKITQNFTSSKLNEKKFEKIFLKELMCQHSTPYPFKGWERTGGGGSGGGVVGINLTQAHPPSPPPPFGFSKTAFSREGTKLWFLWLLNF